MNSLDLPKLNRDVDIPKLDFDVDLSELDFEVFPCLMNSNEDPYPLLINSDETNDIVTNHGLNQIERRNLFSAIYASRFSRQRVT